MKVTHTKVIVYTISMLSTLFSERVFSQNWEYYDDLNSPIVDLSEIQDISVDPSNQDVWIAALDHVYRVTIDNQWTVFQKGITPGLDVAGSIKAKNGFVWTAPIWYGQGGGISMFDGTAWHQVEHPFTEVNIADFEIVENVVYVASISWPNNLYKYSLETQLWNTVNYNDKVNSVMSLSLDEENEELWIGSNCAPNGNVFRYKPATNEWQEYELGQSWCVHAVQVVAPGKVHVGSCNYSSLLTISDGQIVNNTPSECMNADVVTHDPVDPKRAWFGTYDGSAFGRPGGLVLFGGNGVETIFNASNSDMKASNVIAIAAQRLDEFTGKVWLLSSDNEFQQYLETYTYSVESSPPRFDSYSFADLSAHGTIGENTIALNVPAQSDVTNLIATFTNTVGSTVTVNDVVQESGLTANDFSGPVIYKVTSSELAERMYTVSVTKESVTSVEDELFRLITVNVDNGNILVAAAGYPLTSLDLQLYTLQGVLIDSELVFGEKWESRLGSNLHQGVYILVLGNLHVKKIAVIK